MKIIYQDEISATTADEADGSYPVANLADDYPKRVWKGSSKDAQLKFTCPTGITAFAMYNTNATTGTFTIKDSGEVDTLVGPTALTLTSSFTYEHNGFWVDFTDPGEACKIILDLDAGAGNTIEAGIARAGEALTFNDPKYGIGLDFKDFSVKKELSIGATYYRKRDIVRRFSLDFNVTRDNEFYEFMIETYKQYGEEPMAFWLADGKTNYDWTVFGRIITPSGVHDNPARSNIRFVIEEAV